MNFRFFTTLVVAAVLSLGTFGFASAGIIEFSFDGEGVDDFFFTIASDATPDDVTSFGQISFEDITITIGDVTQSDATVSFSNDINFDDTISGSLSILLPGNVDSLSFILPESPFLGFEGELIFLPVGDITVVNTSVPEPSVMTLMLGCVAFVTTRRRRNLETILAPELMPSRTIEGNRF